MAEKFLAQAKDIPHIGNVELSWAATPSHAPSTLAASSDTIAAAALNNGTDVKMDEAPETTKAEVDYDVADDDDRWLID